MGIDALNAAARAAGFAMAGSDELAGPPEKPAARDPREAPVHYPVARISPPAVSRPSLNFNWGLGWSFWKTA